MGYGKTFYICPRINAKTYVMKKYYLFLLFVTALTTTALAAEEFGELDDISEVDVTGVAISINGNQVHVTGAAGQTLEVYNIAGVRVGSYKIDSDDKNLNLNLAKGCYILKVGKVVRKVSIR